MSGTTTPQALYTIDTQGYDSVWSNDIKEIKAGYIASDSTEADLQARWQYYDTNWLGYTGTDRDTAKSMTQLMMNLYNQRVTPGACGTAPAVWVRLPARARSAAISTITASPGHRRRGI